MQTSVVHVVRRCVPWGGDSILSVFSCKRTCKLAARRCTCVSVMMASLLIDAAHAQGVSKWRSELTPWNCMGSIHSKCMRPLVSTVLFFSSELTAILCRCPRCQRVSVAHQCKFTICQIYSDAGRMRNRIFHAHTSTLMKIFCVTDIPYKLFRVSLRISFKAGAIAKWKRGEH